MPSYYDQVLAGMGLTAPASSSRYLRGRAATGSQVAFSPGIQKAYEDLQAQQAAVPSVIYNPGYNTRQLQKQLIRSGQAPQGFLAPLADPVIGNRRPDPNIDVLSSIADAAAVSGDPGYQAALGRAAFAASGTPFVPSYLEGQRQQIQQVYQSQAQRQQQQQLQTTYIQDRNRLASFVSDPRNGITQDQADQLWNDLNTDYAQKGYMNSLPPPPELAAIHSREDDPTVRLTQDMESVKNDPHYVAGMENRLYVDPKTNKTNWEDYDRARQQVIDRKKDEESKRQALYKEQLKSLEERQALLVEDRDAEIIDLDQFRAGILALQAERRQITNQLFGINEEQRRVEGAAAPEKSSDGVFSVVMIDSPEHFRATLEKGLLPSGTKVLLWNGQFRTVK